MTQLQAIYPGLSDKVVLVTGGATGIGAELVRAFAGQGARVAFFDVQHDPALALCTELAGSRHAPAFVACDLSDVDGLPARFREAEALTGPADILVNNAANDMRHRIEEVTPELWDRLQAINLRSQFFAAQAVLEGMKAKGGGCIINMSSVAWRHGPEAMAVYGVAKAGVQGLTLALARAFGRHGIRVNAIEPGAVMTERQRKLWYPTQESVDAMIARQILHAPLLASDIARAALFLASDEARMITKQTLTVDAGLS